MLLSILLVVFIDEALMNELQEVKEISKPDEIMLVVDAMTGQDAVNVAQSFDDQLDVSGVTLTKLDGDTRGGAALSIRSVTQKPIKFVGMSEKLDVSYSILNVWLLVSLVWVTFKLN